MEVQIESIKMDIDAKEQQLLRLKGDIKDLNKKIELMNELVSKSLLYDYSLVNITWT